MKSKKGFTLVELLGAIILMGLISAAIATPILAQLNKASTRIDEAALNLLYSNVDLYMTKYNNTYKKINGNTYYVTIEQLIESGLLEEDFLTAYSEATLSRKTQIRVTVNNNSFDYTIPTTQLSNIKDVFDKLSISSTYTYAGGTYIKGEYTSNYVLYNGFIWRIMGINQDGTIRLIMNQNATTLGYDYTNTYEDSDAREWLNDYFISHLQYNDVIAKQKWYYATTTSSSTTVNQDIYVEDKIGLLSVQEALLSLSNLKTYLVGKENNFLLNINSSQSDTVNYITATSYVSNINKNAILALSPVINVYPNTIVSGGDGNIDTPYILAAYKTNGNGKSLYGNNTMVGDYVSYSNLIFRVVDINSEEVKLIFDAMIEFTSPYAQYGSMFNLDNGAGPKLNNEAYASFADTSKILTKNIFVGGLYTGSSYKNTIFKKQNIVYNVKLSLPVLGEILTTSIYRNNTQTCSTWLLNMASGTTAYALSNMGVATATDVTSTSIQCLRPVIYISSYNTIASGTGTIYDPYILQ